MLLFEFAKSSSDVRDVIIRNFIARGTTNLNSILKLWEIGHYQDCWILQRSLIDRLFHLRALSEDDTFRIFDDWSFMRQYEHRNRVRSDPKFKNTLTPEFWQHTQEQKRRYQDIKKRKLTWNRPRPEAIASNMGLEFLYQHSYDYASTHVHPMSNDGEEDFKRLTGLIKFDEPVDWRVILNNSCLLLVLLIQEGLNVGKLKWRALVYDFLSDFMALLENGSKDYLLTFLKLVSMKEQMEICSL